MLSAILRHFLPAPTFYYLWVGMYFKIDGTFPLLLATGYLLRKELYAL